MLVSPRSIFPFVARFHQYPPSLPLEVSTRCCSLVKASHQDSANSRYLELFLVNSNPATNTRARFPLTAKELSASFALFPMAPSLAMIHWQISSRSAVSCFLADLSNSLAARTSTGRLGRRRYTTRRGAHLVIFKTTSDTLRIWTATGVMENPTNIEVKLTWRYLLDGLSFKRLLSFPNIE